MCNKFYMFSGKTWPRIQNLFFQKLSTEQERANKKVGQIGLSVPEEKGYIQTLNRSYIHRIALV